MNRKVLGTISALIGVALLIASVYGVVSSFTIHESGHISMVKAYSDIECTTEISDIDWGSPQPGTTQNKTVYLKNFGGSSVTVTMTATNWSPANAVNYFGVTWDREGDVLTSGFVLETHISLTVYENITESSIGAFSFDRVINEAW